MPSRANPELSKAAVWRAPGALGAAALLKILPLRGAFPRFARNLGSGEPLSTATTLCVAEQRVYHDPAHPSAIILPIVDEHQEQQGTEAR